jgi:hypothetical protein
MIGLAAAWADARQAGPPKAEAGRWRRPAVRAARRDSARAALIYQHKTTAAGQVIADALSTQIEALEQDHDGRPAQG